MDYVKPADVAAAMIETGRRKLALPTADLLIRGMLSGDLPAAAGFRSRAGGRAVAGRGRVRSKP
jgi:hypothetical protein